MNIIMTRCCRIVLCSLLSLCTWNIISPLHAQSDVELDCNGWCIYRGSDPDTCWTYVDSFHDIQRACTNWAPSGTASDGNIVGSGNCSYSWDNGRYYTSMSCGYLACTVSGVMECRGRQVSYSLSCTNNEGVPQATAERGQVQCSGNRTSSGCSCGALGGICYQTSNTGQTTTTYP